MLRIDEFNLDSERQVVFPVVAKNITNDQKVIFTSPETGMVIEDGGSGLNVGHTSNDFETVFNKQMWVILDSVTITITKH